jgi:hypothetical protein
MTITTFARLALAALTVTAAIAGTASVAGAAGLTIVAVDTPTLSIPSHKTGPGPQHRTYAVECRVHGDNFYIINWGNDNLDSGRTVAWASPSTGDGGTLLLPKSLAPGEEVKLADLLSMPVIPGARCDVALA